MAQKRFIRRGVAKVFYLPLVADPVAGPTRAEITAGTPLEDWIAAITGFGVTSESVATPDLGSRFDSSIPGATSVADSSIQFYDDEDAEDVDDLFPVGTEGFIYFMRKGDKPTTNTSDLYAVRVASKAPNYTTDMTGAVLDITYTVTSEPWLDLPIPATA